MEFNDTTPFAGPFSTIDNPRLEFVMEVRLTFPEVYTLANVPPLTSTALRLPPVGTLARV